MITICKRYSIPIFCGALTPTEVVNAWEAGADAVKIFPAEFFGPAYIKSLKAPLPHIDMVPTGGVNPENVGEFLKAGATPTTAAGSFLSRRRQVAQGKELGCDHGQGQGVCGRRGGLQVIASGQASARYFAMWGTSFSRDRLPPAFSLTK